MVVKNRTRPRSDLRSSIELEHDLGCYRHLLTLYFSIVSSVFASDQTLKIRFFGLTPLPSPCYRAPAWMCGPWAWLAGRAGALAPVRATLSIIHDSVVDDDVDTGHSGSAVTLHTGPHTTGTTGCEGVRSTHTTGDERLYARTSPGTPGAQAGAHSDADSLSQATMKHAPELFACTRGISGDLASLWRVWLWRMLSRHRCTGRCRGQQPCTSRCRRTERRPPSGPGSGAWGSK